MTPERRPYIAGNWKMFKTRGETRAFVEALRPLIEGVDAVDVGLCVPFTALETAVAAAEGSAIKVCAQNMHEEDDGGPDDRRGTRRARRRAADARGVRGGGPDG